MGGWGCIAACWWFAVGAMTAMFFLGWGFAGLRSRILIPVLIPGWMGVSLLPIRGVCRMWRGLDLRMVRSILWSCIRVYIIAIRRIGGCWGCTGWRGWGAGIRAAGYQAVAAGGW